MTRHIACALLSLLVVAAPASADVMVEGTGEPAYTSSSNNTQWVRWTAGTSRLRVDYYVNNVLAHQQTVNNPAAGGGTMWIDWSGVAGVTLPLQEGSRYGICVQGYWTDGSIHFPDFLSSCGDATQRGLRAYTTIDRTKPALTVAPQDGKDVTRDPRLGLRIGYQDALSNPFPATFTCVRTAADPESACGPASGQLAYDAACSVPAQMSKQTTFECTRSLPAATPDGPVSFCAGGADSSLPDKPGSSNQTGSAAEANISTRACTTIVLDRTAPQLDVATAGAAVAGQAVAFTAGASDALSGLTGQVEWSWGDGATGAGSALTHTFAQAGEHTVTATARDRAGNVATKKLTIAVKAPPPQPTEQPQQQPAPATPPAPAAPQLRLTAPKRLALKRGAKLPVALTTNGAGTATVALVRSGRVHVRRAVAIGGPGTRALRLAVPRGLPPGRYRLEVSYRAAGGAATASARVALSSSCRPRTCRRS